MSEHERQQLILLTELSKDVKYLVSSEKQITAALVEHAKVDDTRFNAIDTTLNTMHIQNATLYGRIYGGSAVVGAVAAFLIKVLFK